MTAERQVSFDSPFTALTDIGAHASIINSLCSAIEDTTFSNGTDWEKLERTRECIYVMQHELKNLIEEIQAADKIISGRIAPVKS